MPTISIHLPATTYKRLRARLGRGQNTSSFGRAAIEEKLTGRNAAGPRGLRTDYKKLNAELHEMNKDKELWRLIPGRE
jgi:hypothetical protein